jgi:hypothetical protein
MAKTTAPIAEVILKARRALVLTTFNNHVPIGSNPGHNKVIIGALDAIIRNTGIMKIRLSLERILIDLTVAVIIKNPVKAYTAPLTGVYTILYIWL